MVEVLGWDQIDLDGYDIAARPFIKKAIEKPSSLRCPQLEKVAEEIVYRACLGGVYYRTAAGICQVICQREYEAEEEAQSVIPEYNFRNGLIHACRHMFQDHTNMRNCGVMHWIAFVRFMIRLHEQVRVRGRFIDAITSVVFDCLNTLSQKPSVVNLEETDLLCSVLNDVGPSLYKASPEKVEDVISHCRDVIIDGETDPDVRHMLMEIVELKASDWVLPEAVTQFYFER